MILDESFTEKRYGSLTIVASLTLNPGTRNEVGGRARSATIVRIRRPAFVTDSDELRDSSAQPDEGERTGLGELVASSASDSAACTSCADDARASECGCSTTETRVAAAGARLSSAAAESWAPPCEVPSRLFYGGRQSCQYDFYKSLRTCRHTVLDPSRSRLSFTIHGSQLSKYLWNSA